MAPDHTSQFEHTVAIIGAGKVGTAIGTLLRRSGVRVTAVTARSRQSADAAALATGGEPMTDNAAAARSAEVVLVTVPDGAITRVVREIADAGGFTPGQVVAHVSGAAGLAELHAAGAAGAHVGAMHPIQAFASASHAVREIPGSVFGITADGGAVEVLEHLAVTLGGTPVRVAPEVKPLYHAATALASNCFVALEDMAHELLAQAGFSAEEAQAALTPLVRGTASNLERFGTRVALTGPIARGDLDTVRAHLAALGSAPADVAAAYRLLSGRAAEIALDRGSIDEATASEARALLDEQDQR